MKTEERNAIFEQAIDEFLEVTILFSDTEVDRRMDVLTQRVKNLYKEKRLEEAVNLIKDESLDIMMMARDEGLLDQVELGELAGVGVKMLGVLRSAPANKVKPVKKEVSNPIKQEAKLGKKDSVKQESGVRDKDKKNPLLHQVQILRRAVKVQMKSSLREKRMILEEFKAAALGSNNEKLKEVGGVVKKYLLENKIDKAEKHISDAKGWYEKNHQKEHKVPKVILEAVSKLKGIEVQPKGLSKISSVVKGFRPFESLREIQSKKKVDVQSDQGLGFKKKNPFKFGKNKDKP